MFREESSQPLPPSSVAPTKPYRGVEFRQLLPSRGREFALGTGPEHQTFKRRHTDKRRPPEQSIYTLPALHCHEFRAALEPELQPVQTSCAIEESDNRDYPLGSTINSALLHRLYTRAYHVFLLFQGAASSAAFAGQARPFHRPAIIDSLPDAMDIHDERAHEDGPKGRRGKT